MLTQLIALLYFPVNHPNEAYHENALFFVLFLQSTFLAAMLLDLQTDNDSEHKVITP
jgi:hypothetical protein